MCESALSVSERNHKAIYHSFLSVIVRPVGAVSFFNTCHLMTCLFGHRGVGDVKLHPRNHTPKGVVGSASFSGSFIFWKEQVVIEKVDILHEAGSVSELVWTAAKISPPKGFDSQTFKHVDSRCTSYAILAVFFPMSKQ